MSFKRFLLELWLPSCLVERNHSCNFEKSIIGNIQVKLFEIWTRSSGGYIVLRKSLRNRQRHDGQRPITIAHLEPLAQAS